MSNINIYGPEFIEKLSHSGYKSTTHAIAEIVDNSVDAKATRIDVIFVERSNVETGKNSISDIYFIDNGLGMNKDLLSKCLVFSEGQGKSDKRIGAFGVGLPYSSIFTGKRVDVYSRDNQKNKFNHVFLDVEEMMIKKTIELDEVKEVDLSKEKQIIKDISEIYKDILNSDCMTIVHWSKIDKLDAKKSATLIGRIKKLLGRIYRYKLDDLTIKLTSIIDSRIFQSEEVIKYDPLFISKKPYFVTNELWNYSEEIDKVDNAGIHAELGMNSDLETQKLFNAKYYYRDFLEKDGKGNCSQLPLFQELDGYFDQEFEFKAQGKIFKWKMRASFAYENIANPGIRNGGGTRIGRIFGEKMIGDRNFPSANIYFLRAGREIDFGHYGLYTVSDPKNRFWTIEIFFDSDLDVLMGISNNKQSVSFKYTTAEDLGDSNTEDVLSSERLFADISSRILQAKERMRKELADYARNFKTLEASYLEKEDEKTPILTPNQILNTYIAKHSNKNEWQTEVDTLTRDLHQKYFKHLKYDDVKASVELYKAKLTKEIVMYASLSSGKLFDAENYGNVTVIIINTSHKFYENILSVIKRDRDLKYVTVSIELLLSYLAFHMNDISIQHNSNSEAIKRAIDKIQLYFSQSVGDFICDENLDLNFDKKKSYDEEDEDEEDDFDIE
ncbi:hypothetical protein HMPREF9714_01442 [Myroides odoratimimus CCUG 12901]|uniref:ATP-binding protein n=1 Tax=Myroides odoratimimus TaxID=76832 RepID=UPI0002460954|nr:ATP-binding protein [Myroides odoratimimus]EHO11013.1 hypothetical protein HMPREF9714_01442 [Myroides odoratimimus CCUG 12901]MDM1412417.1 ATP-binding protein [Myroides odoratimimus]